MSHRTAAANNKGGVGKTAVTVYLAAALARLNRRVLVVDMDPQGNATRRLATRLAEDSPTISEAIAAGVRGCATDAIAPCGWSAEYAHLISVIPAAPDLANRAGEAHMLGAVRRLAEAMTGVDDNHDVTLFDCEPSLAHLPQLAFAAVNDVLVVLEPEYDAVEAAIRLRDFVDAYRELLYNPDLRILGYLLSRVRGNLGAHQYQMEGLPNTFGESLIWAPGIAERTVIKDANDAAVPVEFVSRVGREIAGAFDVVAQRYVSEVGAQV